MFPLTIKEEPEMSFSLLGFVACRNEALLFIINNKMICNLVTMGM